MEPIVAWGVGVYVGSKITELVSSRNRAGIHGPVIAGSREQLRDRIREQRRCGLIPEGYTLRPVRVRIEVEE
jgi:hypothetical protein